MCDPAKFLHIIDPKVSFILKRPQIYGFVKKVSKEKVSRHHKVWA